MLENKDVDTMPGSQKSSNWIEDGFTQKSPSIQTCYIFGSYHLSWHTFEMKAQCYPFLQKLVWFATFEVSTEAYNTNLSHSTKGKKG